jgi:hypothetical protein
MALEHEPWKLAAHLRSDEKQSPPGSQAGKKDPTPPPFSPHLHENK